MKNAFGWLFGKYVRGLLLFLTVQIVLLGTGMPFLLASWERTQRREYASQALDVLEGNGEARERMASFSGSFFVFSADRTLVFSNRGKGRAIDPADHIPIEKNGATVGYFYMGDLGFLDDRANRLFFSTLLVLIGFSGVFAFVVGLVSALRSSGKIARPLDELSEDIRRMERLEHVGMRSFEIRELSDISRTVENVSSLLSRQETYKKQWMQDISHDLRTPITGLRGQLEGMRDGVLEADSPRLGRLLGEVERLEGMIRGISELYELESGNAFNPAFFDSREFIEALLGPYELRLKEKRVEVKIVNPLSRVYGDRDQLLRGIGNIVSNAADFVEPGGRLEIAMGSTERSWTMRITNDGPSIPAGQLGLIFDRFFRGDSSRSTPGNGLGLNIAQAVVHRHGGTVDAENLQPCGVGFTVEIPLP